MFIRFIFRGVFVWTGNYCFNNWWDALFGGRKIAQSALLLAQLLFLNALCGVRSASAQGNKVNVCVCHVVVKHENVMLSDVTRLRDSTLEAHLGLLAAIPWTTSSVQYGRVEIRSFQGASFNCLCGHALHSERRGRIATAQPLRRSHSHCAVTSPGGAFQTYTKERTLPIRTWPITDAVRSCSLTDSDVVDHGAD